MSMPALSCLAIVSAVADSTSAGQLVGIDRVAGFLADQQVGEAFVAGKAADMADQDAVCAR